MFELKGEIGVMGGGAWGTALARHMSMKWGRCRLWCYESSCAEVVNQEHENKMYLPGVKLPRSVEAYSVMDDFMRGLGALFIVVPSHTLRGMMERYGYLIPIGIPIICASKGIENETMMTMGEVLEDCLDIRYHPYLSFLSGPSFALDVARGQETAVTIAVHSDRYGKVLQDFVSDNNFRVYRSIDVVGVELGGALKNVIAIASGAAAGMDLGHNALAALVTRGLAEISRLAVSKGANPLTLSGLSGMGDLVLTCYGELSRNRQLGFELGRGKSLESILSSRNSVAEGVKTARSAYMLACRCGVEMPITQRVFECLYEGKDASMAVRELMGRDLKREL